MKSVELEIEHRFQSRHLGTHRLKAREAAYILGSTREADVRLLGAEISGVHAILEFRSDAWVLADMGSDSGTWIKKKPVIEHDIYNTTTVKIGDHELRLMPINIDSELFTPTQVARQWPGNTEFHQVVIRRSGVVLTSRLLPKNKDFEFSLGGKTHPLPAPRGPEWTVTQYGAVIVQQRLVRAENLDPGFVEKVASTLDPEMRWPLVFASMAFSIFMLLAYWLGQNSLAPDQPQVANNQYARLIYDAKAIRDQRKRSAGARQNIEKNQDSKPTPMVASSANPTVQSNEVTPPSTTAAKVVTQFKTQGLQKLLGKISARQAINAKLVQGQGQKAEAGGAGRALASVGGVAVGKTTQSSGGGFKLGGVQTGGKAGGSGSYQGFGGLAAGGVGSGGVDFVEEEVDIQGGLDREVIAQVIQSNLGEIRYCYERQLSANPDLYGKIKVRFTISGQGSVVAPSIAVSTLKNANVEGCILRRLAGWRFPKPKGGTTVNVTYPFLFKSLQ